MGTLCTPSDGKTKRICPGLTSIPIPSMAFWVSNMLSVSAVHERISLDNNTLTIRYRYSGHRRDALHMNYDLAVILFFYHLQFGVDFPPRVLNISSYAHELMTPARPISPFVSFVRTWHFVYAKPMWCGICTAWCGGDRSKLCLITLPPSPSPSPFPLPNSNSKSLTLNSKPSYSGSSPAAA
ncbi:hypothetical protein BDN72DRAFT_57720 [Pluteus cervinus]|uniref:Uncharacterized protein n=1 Tax=Pluteus cervinus TaxID=181527 RepID=A0ACD3B8S6_9AGAR|nr:hypothetical protein BDN72DRAFT_57720 [Pluteus cervinus]